MEQNTGVFEMNFDMNALDLFSKKLESNNKTLEEFAEKNLWLSVFLALVTASLMSFTGFGLFEIVMTALFAIVFVFALSIGLEIQKFESKKALKEKLVVDFLLDASIMPKGTSFEKILENSSKEYGLLGKEFAKVYEMIKKGASVEESLKEFNNRNDSKVLERVAELLLMFYSSGADMAESFKKTAEDILKTQNILSQKNASIVVQKYTVLFAGGLIVPLVLGLLSSMSQGFDFNALNFLFETKTIMEREQLLETLLLANKIYIAEYAIIAGTFLGLQENSVGKGILYGLVLIPVGLIVYFLAGSLI